MVTHGRVERVLDHLVHHLEHFLDEVEKGLDLAGRGRRLMPFQIHYGLQAEHCVVLVFHPHQLHQGIYHIQSVLFHFRRCMLKAMDDFQDLVAEDLLGGCGREIGLALQYLLEHRP